MYLEYLIPFLKNRFAFFINVTSDALGLYTVTVVKTIKELLSSFDVCVALFLTLEELTYKRKLRLSGQIEKCMCGDFGIDLYFFVST